MKSSRPPKPIGTSKKAQFWQAVWEELWGNDARLYDSASIKVRQTSRGKYLEALVGRKSSSLPCAWEGFVITIMSSTWITFLNSLLANGSNCTNSPPGGGAHGNPWIDFDANMSACKSLMDSLDFNKPPIPWEVDGSGSTCISAPPGSAQPPAVNPVKGRYLIYASNSPFSATNAFAITAPSWYTPSAAAAANIISLFPPWCNFRTSVFNALYPGPAAFSYASDAPFFGPAPCNATYDVAVPVLSKVRIRNPGSCVSSYHDTIFNAPPAGAALDSCAVDSVTKTFNYPSGDPSFSHMDFGVYETDIWQWMACQDCTCP